MHPHEIEAIEYENSPRMWDATPGVCCAYFQTGACSHTEGYVYDDNDNEDEMLASVSTHELQVATNIDEPF